MKILKVRAGRSSQAGFSLIEILIALVIGAFGLLALSAFIIKSTMLTGDATQRARAGTLLNDMTHRLSSRKTLAADFVSEGAVYGESILDCDGAANAARDLCEWNNLLAGSNDGGGAAALGYRGCIEQPAGDPNAYIITIAWGSMAPGVPPHENVNCAQGEFGDDDSHRRILRAQVRVASLSGS